MKLCWLVPIFFFFASILNAQEAPLTVFSSCHSSLESEEILSLNADLLCLQSEDVERSALEGVYPYIFSDQNSITTERKFSDQYIEKADKSEFPIPIFALSPGEKTSQKYRKQKTKIAKFYKRKPVLRASLELLQS